MSTGQWVAVVLAYTGLFLIAFTSGRRPRP